MRYRLFIIFGLLHIGLSVAGALRALPEARGPATGAIRWYAALTGADSAFGFFAPGVGTHLDANFEVAFADGRSELRRLESGLTREADLRVGTVVDAFWISAESERLRRSLAASWAGKIMARSPGATAVTVQLRSYYLPTMAEFRQGKTGAWEPYYRAKFAHAASSAGRAP